MVKRGSQNTVEEMECLTDESSALPARMHTHPPTEEPERALSFSF